jgi:8-oxo-dGTP pyrophosphatase MutT (NUDIX family)
MSKGPHPTGPKPILAAGGVLLGTGDNRGKIAIVRRRRYPGEVSLPKGKLQHGEEPIDAALREVREETGYQVKVREYAGTTHYFVGTVPKSVSYFVMEPKGEGDRSPEDAEEIESVEWMAPEEAVRVLTHRDDRDLIAALFALGKDKRE